MSVDSILLNGIPTTFNHNNDELAIDLDRVYNQDETISLVVYYDGIPGASGLGSFKFGTHGNQPIISTLSEPYGASDWWPNKDTPADKPDSADIWITVTQSMIPISNGTLEEIIVNGNGTHTYKWKEKYPIAAYLISMAITNYFQYNTYYNYSPTDSMIITHYIYPENFNTTLQSKLDETSAMIEVFSEKFGEYPFLDEKYGHAEFTGMFGGAMEHQTCTSMGFWGQEVISHELAHQWFGDKITCKDWHHIWLNEGFATYLEAVYVEAINGHNAYKSKIQSEMNSAKNAQGTIWVQDITNIGEIFNGARSYAKGAVVLHMLRGVVGDEAFFNIMNTYSNDPLLAYGVATTEDFQLIAETVSGMDLNYFFQEWIYGVNEPTYTAGWSKTLLGGNQYKVNLNITQAINLNPPFFTMPVQIRINTSSNDTIVTVINDQQSQDFEIVVTGEPSSIVFDPENNILKNTVNIVTNIGNQNQAEVFSLEQNFPNPFNPNTKIKFSIPSETPSLMKLVQLKVFDVLGEEVATLINKEFEAGNYEIDFIADNLPSGIYYYTLSTGNFTETKKMLLLK
jgi:aminopeptidase N